MNFLSNLWSGLKSGLSSAGQYLSNQTASAIGTFTGPLSPTQQKYGNPKVDTSSMSAEKKKQFGIQDGPQFYEVKDSPLGQIAVNTNDGSFQSYSEQGGATGPTYFNQTPEQVYGNQQAMNKIYRPSTYSSSSTPDNSTRKSTKAEGEPYYNAQGFLIIPDKGFSGISGQGGSGFAPSMASATGAQGASGSDMARGYGGAGQGTTSTSYNSLSSDEKKRQEEQNTQLLTTKPTASALAAMQANGQQAPINAPEVPPVIDAGFITKVQDTILNTKNSGLSEMDKQTVYSQLQTNLLAAKQKLDQQVALPENPVVDTKEQLDFINQNQDPFGVKQLIDQVKSTQTNLGQLETTRVDLMKNVQALNQAYAPIIKEIKDNPNLPKALARRKIESLATSQKEVLQGFLDQLQVVNQQIDDQNQIVNRTLQIANFAQGQQNTAVDNARQALQLMISSGAIAGATDGELQQYASTLGMPLAGLKKAKEAAYDSKLDIVTNEFPDGSLKGVDKKTGKVVWSLAGASSPSAGNQVKSGGLTLSGADISAGVKKLNDSGNDPSVYLEMYNTWKAKGGLPQDFTKSYPPELYINPANTWLPRELVPKSSTPSINFS